MIDVKIFPNSEELAQAAAEEFVRRAEESINLRGLFSVALSGGSTPQAMYRLLASPEFNGRVDWSRVYVFWGDERCVAPDHPASNYGKAKETFLSKAAIPDGNIHRILGELAPEQAAKAYEEELLAFFSSLPEADQRERAGFDLVLMGMGDDGHTASLFPGSTAVKEVARWVVAHYVDKLAAWRITLTPAIFNRAMRVLFLVTGADKSYPLQRVLYGPYQPERYPAQLIQPVDGNCLWMVDEPAARLF